MRAVKPTGKILFRETQQFRQAWLWALLISGSLIPLVLVSVLLPQDKNIPLGSVVLVISLLVGTFSLNMAALYFTRLETVVTDQGLYFRWWPFTKKYNQLYWQEIGTITVKKYPFLHYGYSRRAEWGKIHFVDGNRGVHFELLNGKKVFIGSQKLTAFQYSLEQMKPVEVQLK
jgi:hypothetical protein